MYTHTGTVVLHLKQFPATSTSGHCAQNKRTWNCISFFCLLLF